MKEINEFKGEYRWLSNFWPCSVAFEGVEYPSVEHAFVAAKTTKESTRKVIKNLKTAAEAKRLGRSLKLRDDWDSIKLSIMKELIAYKFTKNYVLKDKLMETDKAQLIEGNTWNDTYWGVCNGIGYNHLGKILMSTREILIFEQDIPF